MWFSAPTGYGFSPGEAHKERPHDGALSRLGSHGSREQPHAKRAVLHHYGARGGLS